MDRRFPANCQHFTKIVPHETKASRARAIPYRAYDDDATSLILAMIGVALIVATVGSMLVAFKVF
jgi:hypothetical protein